MLFSSKYSLYSICPGQINRKTPCAYVDKRTSITSEIPGAIMLSQRAACMPLHMKNHDFPNIRPSII